MSNSKQDEHASRPTTTESDQPSTTPTGEQAIRAINESQAQYVRETAAAAYLYATVHFSLDKSVSLDALKLYREQLLEEAGNPDDPIEIMMIEQLALAHLSIGRLRIYSCAAADVQMITAYGDAATRLLAEFRRCTLALEEYRSKRAARSTAPDRHDKTKRVARERNGQKPPSANGSHKKQQHTEVASNGHMEDLPWLKKRMGQCPTPVGSPQVVAIA